MKRRIHVDDDDELITELNESIYDAYLMFYNSVYENLDEVYDEDNDVFENNISNYVKERYIELLEMQSSSYITEGDVMDRIKLAFKDNSNNLLLSRIPSMASMGVLLGRAGYATYAGLTTTATVAATGAPVTFPHAFGAAFMMASPYSFFLGAPAAMLALVIYNALKPQDIRVITSYEAIFKRLLRKIDAASKKQKDFSKTFKDQRFKKVYSESLKECGKVVSTSYTQAAFSKLTGAEKKKFARDRDLTLASCQVNSTVDFQLKFMFPIFIEKYKTLLVQENEYKAEEIDPLNFDDMINRPMGPAFRYVEDYKNNWFGTFKRMISAMYKFNNKEVAKTYAKLNTLATETKSKAGGGEFDFAAMMAQFNSKAHDTNPA